MFLAYSAIPPLFPRPVISLIQLPATMRLARSAQSFSGIAAALRLISIKPPEFLSRSTERGINGLRESARIPATLMQLMVYDTLKQCQFLITQAAVWSLRMTV